MIQGGGPRFFSVQLAFSAIHQLYTQRRPVSATLSVRQADRYTRLCPQSSRTARLWRPGHRSVIRRLRSSGHFALHAGPRRPFTDVLFMISAPKFSGWRTVGFSGKRTSSPSSPSKSTETAECHHRQSRLQMRPFSRMDRAGFVPAAVFGGDEYSCRCPDR